METALGVQNSSAYLRNKNGEVYHLKRENTTIGRSGDIYFPKDRYMSKVHASIKSNEKGYFISDNKSSNGTRVNSKVINKSVKLSSRDIIVCGKIDMEFRNE